MRFLLFLPGCWKKICSREWCPLLLKIPRQRYLLSLTWLHFWMPLLLNYFFFVVVVVVVVLFKKTSQLHLTWPAIAFGACSTPFKPCHPRPSVNAVGCFQKKTRRRKKKEKRLIRLLSEDKKKKERRDWSENEAAHFLIFTSSFSVCPAGSEPRMLNSSYVAWVIYEFVCFLRILSPIS